MDERRSETRHSTCLQVTARALGRDVPCILRDISEGGAQLWFTGHGLLRRGDMLTLNMFTEDGKRPLKVAGKIAWIRSHRQHCFGVEFKSQVPVAIKQIIASD